MHLYTTVFGSFIHIILVLLFEAVFLFAILYPLLTRIANNITNEINNQAYSAIIQNNKNAKKFISYNPETEKYYINEASIKAIFEYGAIDEKRYLKVQTYMPYIIFAILVFSLIIASIVWVLYTKHMGGSIDWLFVFITSAISFGIICLYAFGILWYVIFTQPYVMDINADLLETFLEVYNSQ